MQEYFTLIYKCVVIYFVIIIAMRVMGKREVGELSIFDVVIYLVMSELLAISISEKNESILKSLVAIITLALMQVFVSWILLKSKKSRDIFDGKSVVLIHNGHINQEVMRRERYNIDDLMTQLHEKNIGSPQEVEFAVMETNGTLTVLEKNKCKVKHPSPLISDGVINQNALADLHRDEAWLNKLLIKEGVNSAQDVFLCLWQKDGLYVVKKELGTAQRVNHVTPDHEVSSKH